VGLAAWTRPGLHFHRHRQHRRPQSPGVAVRSWCITTLCLVRTASSLCRAAQAAAATAVTGGTQGPPAGEHAHLRPQHKASEFRNSHRCPLLHVNLHMVGSCHRLSLSDLASVAPMCRKVALATHRHHSAATLGSPQGLLQVIFKSPGVSEKRHCTTSAEMAVAMAAVHPHRRTPEAATAVVHSHCHTLEAAKAAVHSHCHTLEAALAAVHSHCHTPDAHSPIIVQGCSCSVRPAAAAGFRVCHSHMRQWLPYKALRRQTSLAVAVRSVSVRDCQLVSHRLHKLCSSGFEVIYGRHCLEHVHAHPMQVCTGKGVSAAVMIALCPVGKARRRLATSCGTSACC